MKFLSLALLAVVAVTVAVAEETATNAEDDPTYTGEIINAYVHDGSTFNETTVYGGTCEDQSHCLGFSVEEVQRRCGSGSCEYLVCYSTNVGHVPAQTFYDYWDAVTGDNADQQAAEATVESCKQHPDFGVDYAGNVNTDATDEDTGGCINGANSQGKGFWDDTCINPEVADEDTGVNQHTEARFSSFCQVVAPGHTVHFMMHSYNGLDWNGENAASVSCRASAEATVDATGEVDKFGSAKCAPSSQAGPNGQTWFPANDASTGGTCSDEPEGEECVWSYTAPNECLYEENDPTCALTQDSVDTLTTTCPDGEPIVEYFEHSANPNDAPPRIPFHNLVHNDDGTVSFQIYNPYGNYAEPIDYSETQTDESIRDDYKYGTGGANDLIDMYVVYDKANEIGNEVCDMETAVGKCATDNSYTAKCRTDGIAVVTVFASGQDATSAVAAQITNDVGTEPFGCCPETYQPDYYFSAATTAAWTFLIHCDCPPIVEDVDLDRRRQLRESISSKFQNGEYFDTENQKKLHKIL